MVLDCEKLELLEPAAEEFDIFVELMGVVPLTFDALIIVVMLVVIRSSMLPTQAR